MKFLILSLFGLGIFSPSLFSQAPAYENKIARSLTDYKTTYIQERLYVHTDKEAYLVREILWFRLYYFDIYFGRPDSISKIAYIELLDGNNLPVVQEKVSLKPGESEGSIVIPLNLASGWYKLRAYTSWMKNFGVDGFFEKPIKVINPFNLVADSSVQKSRRYDIQFFPEGGNLVQDIKTKLAFRMTDAYGKGLDCKGILFDSRGDTVARFSPSHFGLGNFYITPLAGTVYKALIVFPNGTTVTKELPVVYPAGFVMNLTKTTEGEIAVQVSSSPNLNSEEVYLLVHGSRSMLPVKKEKISDRNLRVLINEKDLEDGISKFTLFDKSGQPVCERLYFKYPARKFLISALTDSVYTTRKKIDLSLASANQSGAPLKADMSLAVYRLDSVIGTGENNIRNYFYLTAELGTVESPEYYFRDELSKQPDMDNLMLTHGWRRFDWKHVTAVATENMVFPPEINGHIIRGRMMNSKTGLPVANINAYISVPSLRTQFRSSVSDTKGQLNFEMKNFYGSQELIVQTKPNEDSSYQIEISNPFFEKYSAVNLPAYSGYSKNSPELLDQVIHEQVQHNYDGYNLSQFMMQQVDTNPFYVVPDEKYLLDDFTRFLTMEEVMREYVRSVNVIRKKDRFQLYLVENANQKFFSGEPLILIDGVPFFDANELFQQDPKKIKRIDLLNREYALGDMTFQGIVNVTTYRGDLDGIQMNARATVLDYPGIPEQREFFSPAYETEKQINSRMPDFRTLLYWSPEVKTDSSGKAQLQFYTSDLPGKYAVVIQGISDSGEPASKVVFFEVKK